MIARATGTQVEGKIHHPPQVSIAELGYAMNACSGEWLGGPATSVIGSSGGRAKGPATNKCLQPVNFLCNY